MKYVWCIRCKVILRNEYVNQSSLIDRQLPTQLISVRDILGILCAQKVTILHY